MALIQVNSTLKSERTFPTNQGRQPVTPGENWIDESILDYLEEKSDGFQHFVSKKNFEVVRSKKRDESPTEAAQRKKRATKDMALKEAMKTEEKSREPVSSEEIQAQIEAGKKALEEKAFDLAKDQAEQLTEEADRNVAAYEAKLKEKAEEQTAAFLEGLQEKAAEALQFFLENIKENMKPALAELAKEQTESVTVDIDVKLQNAIESSLDEFRKEADKVTKAHRDALKKAASK